MNAKRASKADLQWTEDDLLEMVTRLAHEIRNPLATIKSGLQLIQHLTKPVGDVAEYLDGMIAEVSRIDHTVRTMQHFVGLVDAHPQPASVPDLAASALEAHRAEAERRGIELRLTAAPPCVVLADPEQIVNALEELIANAVSFTPEGGAVKVGWSMTGAGEVVVHVDDEGPGVKPEHAARILRPFFSTSSGGVGLGLATVERICKLSGGRLEWRNLPEHGCRFALVLPAA